MAMLLFTTYELSLKVWCAPSMCANFTDLPQMMGRPVFTRLVRLLCMWVGTHIVTGRRPSQVLTLPAVM